MEEYLSLFINFDATKLHVSLSIKKPLLLKVMTKQFVLFLFVFICFGFFAQNRVNKDQLSENWKLINTVNGVNFFAKLESVDLYKNGSENFTYVVVKVENTTSTDVNLNFLISGFYDGGCLGCVDNVENTKSLSLKANETFVGTAENHFSRLVQNPKLKNSWKFEAIGINNVIFKN